MKGLVSSPLIGDCLPLKCGCREGHVLPFSSPLCIPLPHDSATLTPSLLLPLLYGKVILSHLYTFPFWLKSFQPTNTSREPFALPLLLPVVQSLPLLVLVEVIVSVHTFSLGTGKRRNPLDSERREYQSPVFWGLRRGVCGMKSWLSYRLWEHTNTTCMRIWPIL